MKRGTLVIVRERQSPASKSRPCVVIQRTSTIEASDHLTVCPLTSTLRGPQGQRPMIVATQKTGLEKPSEVEIDWVFTFPTERVGKIIGEIDDVTMRAIDNSLRRWLDL